MPDVPQNIEEILPAAGGRAGVLAEQLRELARDLAQSTGGNLSDEERRRGEALLAEAAEALAALGRL